MSVKVTPYWEGYICALSDAKFSASVIVKMCSARGNNISRRTVARVIQRCKSTGPKYQDQVVRVKRKRACPARTPRVVRNIRAAVVKENPHPKQPGHRMQDITEHSVSYHKGKFGTEKTT